MVGAGERGSRTLIAIFLSPCALRTSEEIVVLSLPSSTQDLMMALNRSWISGLWRCPTPLNATEGRAATFRACTNTLMSSPQIDPASTM